MEENSPLPGGGAAFPTTQWTVIIEAASDNPTRAKEALEKLCGAYREPIVNWFRRRDYYQDPEDLTQSFVAYLIEKNLLNRVAPRTGLFRAFLADTMQKFLWDTWDKASAQKRGRNVDKVSLSENDMDIQAAGHPDSQLDADFALVIHRRVMGSLMPADELKQYIFQKDSSEGWEAIAARLGKTSGAVRKEVSRLRRNHWESFRNEVAQIVTPANRVEETRYLYELLFRHLPAE
jgi:RNA polymerase sigma-70 factor (ECF subfamily)